MAVRLSEDDGYWRAQMFLKNHGLSSCAVSGRRAFVARVDLNFAEVNGSAKRFVEVVRAFWFPMKGGGEFSLRSRLAATVAALFLAIALGVVDYLTGRELVISAFYLLPTLLAAWVAGRWSGLIVGVLCTCVWFLSDLLGGPAYQYPLIPVWNAMMLLVFFVVVVWLLTEFRQAHYQLEKTVERRTAALQAEIDERKRLEHVRRTLGLHVGRKVAEQILARDGRVGGSEQHVTVMFVDIRSFTARTENLEPREAVSFLNRFLHAMVQVVEMEHGGMINKFLGDGFMALFGVDCGQRDHADKALAAGRDLQHRLERLNSDPTYRSEQPIRVGIGINSGRVIVGSIGSSERMEFTVIGSTVNIASRIEALNKTLGTTLLLSRATRDALRRPLALRALPLQSVEGVDRPLETFTPEYA
jgi:class 3 adenylate cyclase